MATDISIETAGPALREVVEHLRPGERVNLVGSDGRRLAVVLSVRPDPANQVSSEEWMAKWRALAREISKAWKSDKSAVELVSEMRR